MNIKKLIVFIIYYLESIKIKTLLVAFVIYYFESIIFFELTNYN